MKQLLYSALLFNLLWISACKKQMETSAASYALTEFDTLKLESVFEVFLIQGNENSLRIEAAKKILEAIDFDISNNTLKLKNTFKGSWRYPQKNKVKLYITFNQISKIYVNESCHIKTMNALKGNEIGLIMGSKYNSADLELDCSTFYYWNNFPCGGQIKLSGKTNELKLWNVALMAIDARALRTNFALVNNASKGNCSINCTQRLSYKITGSGNIIVKGNPPQIEKVEESASGRLILE
jgi:hypothetical protein